MPLLDRTARTPPRPVTPASASLPGRGLDTEASRRERLQFVRERTGAPLRHCERTGLTAEQLHSNIENLLGSVEIPVGVAGPLRLCGEHAVGEVLLPMATTEGALVASTTRGARALTESGGVTTRVLGQRMIRAPFFAFESLGEAALFARWASDHLHELDTVAAEVSRHGRLSSVEPLVFGSDVHLRFVYETGDAAGQNMTTACTWHACQWILEQIRQLPVNLVHFFLEANVSSDKKASFGSFINGRGMRVIAEARIDGATLRKVLKVDQACMLRGHAAGVTGSQAVGAMGHNINVANVVAAVFAACGQDVACVHESSLGMLQVLPWEDGIYVSMVLPSLVIGTVGGGTHLPQQQDYLQMLGCAGADRVRRLGEIIAGFCLALDLSTMSALASGHFAHAHERLGRNRPVQWFSEAELDVGWAQELITAHHGPGTRVLDVHASQLEVGSSVITESSARRAHGKTLGFFPLQLRVQTASGQERTLETVVKIKPLSGEVLTVMHSVAPACGPQVTRELLAAEHTLDLTDCHRRELAIYRQKDPRFKAHVPHVYGVVEQPERELYAVMLERLDGLELLNQVDDVRAWTDAHLRAAIDGLAQLHAIWFGHEEQLLSQPWIGCPPDVARMRQSRGLWYALADHGREEYPDWVTPERHAIWRHCLELLDTTYGDLERMPRTLIHGDFNPRNIAFRREAGGLRLCAYDWELATLHVPQRDLAELLAFTLPLEGLERDTVQPYLYSHRRGLELATGATLCPRTFERGFTLALRDLLVRRLGLYTMVHACRDHRFLPRVFAVACRLLQLFERPSHDSGAFLRGRRRS